MRVALTGATGFLGTRLVRELLARHEAITILTRAGGADPVDRIARVLDAIGAPEPRLAERLQVVEIELTQPGLGLSTAVFRELADELDAVWHCAGDIDLEADLARVRAVNVEGTRNLLALAAAGRRDPLFCHISTAFVAGARRTGLVYEDDLDGSCGFENAYERSKYEAELLVHSWAAAHRRSAVVLRPSILVDDRAARPDLPTHPLQTFARTIGMILKQAASLDRSLLEPGRDPVRLPGAPRAHLNLIPVDEAASAMVELARVRPVRGVDTYHVVHHRDVTVADFQRAFGETSRTRFTLVQGTPARMTELEAEVRELVTTLMSGFLPYLGHQRRYDDTRVRKVLGRSAGTTQVDTDYLLSGLRTASSPVEATR
ncbi:SDR family oxidoreductase [Actinosynnema sp. NPDC051121]